MKVHGEVYFIEFPRIGDPDRGFLTFVEGRPNRAGVMLPDENPSVPFDIKRAYWIYGVGDPAVVRGGHAHRTVKQVFLCLHGAATLSVDLLGMSPITFRLQDPHLGLYISELVWMAMSDFAPDTVILALASDYHNEAEYIRDYQEFQRLVKVAVL